MIYITQLIYVKRGKESVFHEFEDFAIPLMEEYTGRLIHRLRPSDACFVTSNEEKPYEIHLVSFESDSDLTDFLNDDRRMKFKHLKDDSVKSVLMVKGHKM